jgi:hypothetical protein
VNKKKQKNFINLGRAGFSAAGLKGTKVFAPLFSKSGCFKKRPHLAMRPFFVAANVVLSRG